MGSRSGTRGATAPASVGGALAPPTYRAVVWLSRDGKRITKSFPTLAAAKTWRADAQVALAQGTMRPPTPLTVRQAAKTWLADARDGSIRDRSRAEYKPATVRSYEEALRLRVLPALGDYRLSELRRSQVQGLVDQLAGTVSASSIRNTLDPLRAICRGALVREQLAVNPTTGLELPASRGRRDRIASVTEAAALIAALPSSERAAWATAFYAGLRRGELRGLQVDDIDLGRSEICVVRSWDAAVGPIEPKSAAGRRTVPLLGVLRDHLDEHLLRTGRRRTDLVFGRTPSQPFVPSTLRNRALRAWQAANHQEAKWAEEENREPVLLTRIGLHECRHTFASLLIAAGENPKAIQEFMGHATIQMTFDRYGHLMPGSCDEARWRMDAYLAQDAEASGPAGQHAAGFPNRFPTGSPWD